MLSLDKYRRKLISSEIKNFFQIWCVRLFGPLYKRIFPSDIAYMLVEHPVILPFLINVKRHLGLTIHFVKPGGDFSNYRKVIVPNGLWPSVQFASSLIPECRKIYCEVGFLPQNKNVYFDPSGVHGHASLRNAQLSPLTEARKKELDSFRSSFTQREFIRVKWDSIDIGDATKKERMPLFAHEFIFVPLQLETDTAFDLCPFENNQAIIAFIQASFPDDRVVFKVHPLDDNGTYKVDPPNILLPNTNRDLRDLICQSKAVVACNSTVILEALLFQKKCGTFGTGLTTNHGVTLECHDDLEMLSKLHTWEPDWSRVDSFLSLLLETQLSVDFFLDPRESNKVIRNFSEYGIIKKSI